MDAQKNKTPRVAALLRLSPGVFSSTKPSIRREEINSSPTLNLGR